eukprot:4487952-Pyramimonas_sp.AAC.1
MTDQSDAGSPWLGARTSTVPPGDRSAVHDPGAARAPAEQSTDETARIDPTVGRDCAERWGDSAGRQ